MRAASQRDANTAYFDRGRRVMKGEASAELRLKKAEVEFCKAFNAFALRECSRAIIRLRGNLANGRKTNNLGRVNSFRVTLMRAIDEIRASIKEANAYSNRPILRPIMLMLDNTRSGVMYHWEHVGNRRVKPFAGLDEYVPHDALVCLERAYDVGRFSDLQFDTQETIKEFVRSYYDIQRRENGLGRPDDGWASEWVSHRIGELVAPKEKVRTRKRKIEQVYEAEESDSAGDAEQFMKDRFDAMVEGNLAAASADLALSDLPRKGRPPIEQTLARAYVDLHHAQELLFTKRQQAAAWPA